MSCMIVVDPSGVTFVTFDFVHAVIFSATWTTYNDVCPAYQTEDRVTKLESFRLNSYLAASNLRL
jgi:exoribonuclease R